MTLGFDDFLHHIRTEAGAFDASIAAAPGDGRVPACPEWQTADLRDHQAEVLAFWLVQLRDEATVDEPHLVENRDLWAGVAVADLGERIAARLTEIGPEVPTWNWSRGEKTSGWVARRMAQELSVHRCDADSIVGPPAPIVAPVAADGIDELLDVFVGADEVGAGPVLELAATDTGRRWTARLGAEGAAREADVAADGRVEGTTSDILLALWDRPTDATWSGDSAVRAAWKALASFE